MSGLARSRGLLLALAGLAVIAGCSSGGSKPAGQKPAGPAGSSVPSPGAAQGILRLVVPPGPVQNGEVNTKDDWVTPFEKQTGCRVTLKNAGTDAEAVGYMTQNNFYDGILASPEAAGQLIAGRTAAPLNVHLIDGYQALSSRLRNAPGEVSGGKVYAVPYLWDAYVVGYNPGAVKPAPRGWDALFAPSAAKRHSGKITVPDAPVTLALAALYLRSARPSLGITDPFELNQSQFGAAVKAVDAVRGSIGTYWAQDSSVIGQFGSAQDVLGAVLRRQVDALDQAGLPAASVPSSGSVASGPAIGWVGSWLMSARAQHPGCMYRWLSWSASHQVQQQVSAWTGQAPARPAACAGAAASPCDRFHEAVLASARNLVFEHLPAGDCGGGRTGCVAYPRWQSAWTRLASAATG